MNQKPAQWERQLAAARAYAKLSDEDKAALDALDKATRNDLHYGSWEPTNAERRALGGVPLAALKEAIHEARPDVSVGLRFRQDGSAELSVLRRDGESIKITGFDSAGEIGDGGLTVTQSAGDGTSASSALTDFDAPDLARWVAKTLSPPPPPGKYAASDASEEG